METSIANCKVRPLSKKEIFESRRLKPDDIIEFNLGKSRSIQTNVPIKKIDPIDTLVIEKEAARDDKQNEPIPQVANSDLNPSPKEPDQIETEFDMGKDEWTLDELLALNITQIPFLVEKLIPLQTLNVLAGQSEIGKSTFYTQLALAIIRGDEEYIGCKLSLKYKRVLVVSTEDGPVALSFRANKQINQATVSEEFRNNLTFFFNQDNLEVKVEKHLKKSPVDLIIIDAFGDVFRGDINASNSVRQYLDTYSNFKQKYGCTVLFVHHICKGNKKQKSEKDQLLGSTGIEGKMRNVLMLSIVNDQHQLSIAKSNYVNREDKKVPFYLDFDTETLTFSRADGPAKPKETAESDVASSGASRAKSKPGRQIDQGLYNKAIQLHKEGKPQVEIAKEVGKDKSTICKWLKEYKSKPPQYDTSLVGDVE